MSEDTPQMNANDKPVPKKKTKKLRNDHSHKQESSAGASDAIVVDINVNEKDDGATQSSSSQQSSQSNVRSRPNGKKNLQVEETEDTNDEGAQNGDPEELNKSKRGAKPKERKIAKRRSDENEIYSAVQVNEPLPLMGRQTGRNSDARVGHARRERNKRSGIRYNLALLRAREQQLMRLIRHEEEDDFLNDKTMFLILLLVVCVLILGIRGFGYLTNWY